jgi:hypothetical protein
MFRRPDHAGRRTKPEQKRDRALNDYDLEDERQ